MPTLKQAGRGIVRAFSARQPLVPKPRRIGFRCHYRNKKDDTRGSIRIEGETLKFQAIYKASRLLRGMGIDAEIYRVTSLSA